MFRILNFVSVLALLAAAGAVYQVKYSSASEAQKIAKLRDDIRAERDRIAILNAEWARRTAPDRIQSLAEHHLDMQSLDVDHIDTLDKLPAKTEHSDDALGGMIEALSDGPMATSSIGKLLAADKGADKPLASGAHVVRPSAPIMAQPVATAPLAVRPTPARAVPGAPLPLSALPSAGVMGSAGNGLPIPAPAGRAPLVSAPVTSAVPLLPPGMIGN
ncbi:hypothetical protein MWN34_14970 [Ancylobacter sp. 6x-1]|uniref:Cell division protein FtsL n=1 Tax=Ancylobacter crimeensis TaxID=2579147 RepID=A0ABT0DEB7_9HYPH|nr:hypothetical protein [Ancylobacter crimeensis]MCK0198214.1 hypothetical protein [Ancylobacter crimeensis]